MTIYFNITEARDYLFNNKVVYILRERKRHQLGINQIRQGIFIDFKVIGKCRVIFVKSITDDNELKPYLQQSGFNTIEDWRKKVDKGKYLYKVELRKRRRKIEVIDTRFT